MATQRVTILGHVSEGLQREFFTQASVDRLREAAHHLGGDLAWGDRLEGDDVRVLVTSWGTPPLTAEVLDRMPLLELVAHTGATVRPFVTDELFARGIRVTQAGQAMARSVAEVSLAFTLALLHRIPEFDHALHDAVPWDEAEQSRPRHELLGSPIGVVGASRTGRAYLEMLRLLGANILISDPFLTAEGATELGGTLVELPELLSGSRVVALHAPSLPETRQLIGREQLALMPRDAGLVNTARSWLVDEEALLDELRSGRLTAAIDVFDEEPLPVDSPFRRLPNALLVPHKAAGTVEGRLSQGALIVDEVARHVEGDPLHHLVMPADLERMA